MKDIKMLGLAVVAVAAVMAFVASTATATPLKEEEATGH